MFTFNNETIFTGYIKQLLADFNLPKYKVYTQADAKYHEEAVEHNKHLNSGDEAWPEESVNIIETITDKDADSQDIKYIRYINYIKGNNIERYINNKWVPTKWHYHYNKKELNQTKNLSIKNNIYDSYTHEYLGEYLRFQRDYNNINLMSMYNCFSNTICQNLYINHSGSQKIKFIFDTDNKNYRIYMLPVKLFKKYTIAIDSSEPVEMCCSFFSKYYLPEISYDSIAENNNTVFNLEELTYKKFTALQFNTPIIYDKLWISDNKKEGCLLGLSKEQRVICTQHEADLKLFIKLPLNNKSSITVLEGDYSHFNDTLLKVVGSSANIVSNKSVTNFDETDIDVLPVNKQKLLPISSLELLAGNTGVSYPFADRLLEYLLDNVITPIDDISDNIKRVQKVIGFTKAKNNKKKTSINGLWQNEYRHYLYSQIVNNAKILPEEKYDLLGYVDKDTEKYYTAEDEHGNDFTIANIDIYPDIYKDN